MEKTGYFDTDEYKQRRLAFIRERKCQAEGCYNYQLSGYIYCVNHIYGFPSRMSPQEIQWWMEEEANGNNKEKGTH